MAWAGKALKSGESEVVDGEDDEVDDCSGVELDESLPEAYVEAGIKKSETFGASAGAVPSLGVAELEDCGAAALDDEESVAEASLEDALASAVDIAESVDQVLEPADEDGMPVAADKSPGAAAGT